jgi:hypothetical protein
LSDPAAVDGLLGESNLPRHHRDISHQNRSVLEELTFIPYVSMTSITDLGENMITDLSIFVAFWVWVTGQEKSVGRRPH